jgi:hypothetical protein
MLSNPLTYRILGLIFTGMAGLIAAFDIGKRGKFIRILFVCCMLFSIGFGITDLLLSNSKNTELSEKYGMKPDVTGSYYISNTTIYNQKAQNSKSNQGKTYKEPKSYGIYYGTIQDIKVQLKDYFNSLAREGIVIKKVNVLFLNETNANEFIPDFHDFIHGEGFGFSQGISTKTPIKGINIDSVGVKKSKEITIVVGSIKIGENTIPQI